MRGNEPARIFLLELVTSVEASMGNGQQFFLLNSFILNLPWDLPSEIYHHEQLESSSLFLLWVGVPSSLSPLAVFSFFSVNILKFLTTTTRTEASS